MQLIGGVPRDKFLEVAEEVMARFLALPENPKPERTGGYMAVLRISGIKMLFVNEIGECAADLSIRCFGYCQEKVRRLLGNLEEDHVSSWQSRNPEKKEYGGAIKAPVVGMGIEAGKNIIGAVSGLVEHGDEAVTLVIWMVFRWIILDEAQEIIKISRNPFFYPLLEACDDIFKSFEPVTE
jgi:hypothetical protein